ncbi:MAG TPA: hypothetical protein VHP37_22790 [Burkholderiales bacterium]|nr:hypothetical protein [Burkholderiales bacterium]
MAALAHLLKMREPACRLHGEALIEEDEGYALCLEQLVRKIDGVLALYRDFSTRH